MHMRVAGRVRNVCVLADRQERFAAQILNDDGSCFSFPIGMGEAGFYWDRELRMWYAYPPLEEDDDPCPRCGGDHDRITERDCPTHPQHGIAAD
jgi:hypothetical protein